MDDLLLVAGAELLYVEEPQCVTVTVTVSFGQLSQVVSLGTI